MARLALLFGMSHAAGIVGRGRRPPPSLERQVGYGDPAPQSNQDNILERTQLHEPDVVLAQLEAAGEEAVDADGDFLVEHGFAGRSLVECRDLGARELGR